MCDDQGSPAGVAEALAMLGRALDHLNAAYAGIVTGQRPG